MTTNPDFVSSDLEPRDAAPALRRPTIETTTPSRSRLDEAPDVGALDLSQIEDLRELLGRDAFAKLLVKFGADLRRRRDKIEPGASRADVAFNAHAMVSSAGSLGFTAFSDLCRTVERLADGDSDLAPSIAAFTAASGDVLRAIETLVDLP